MDEDFREVTALLESGDGESAEALLDRLPVGVYVLDADLECVFANDRVGEFLDTDRTETPIAERLRSRFDDAHERALENGESITADTYHEPAETWLEVRLEPTGSGLTGCLRDVSRRRERERRFERQRERMEALNGVYEVMRAINDVVVTDASRAELERTTCETLADTPGYEFAFVAGVDSATGEITQRIEAGIEGYVERIPLSTDPDEPSGRGPAGRAIRTQRLQVSNDVLTDPDFEPWREDARELGYRSAAAIPIVHGGGLYGVLGVTSAHRHAFTEEVGEGIGQLGEILGHAIAAIERKRALMGDQLIELEYEIKNAVDMFDGPEMTDRHVSFERVVRVDDEQFLEYGVTSVEAFPEVETLVERVPHWEDVTVLDESAGEITFELTITSPPLFSVVASHGGYVESAAIDGGDYRMTIHLPESADIRAATEAIQDVYPDATNVARRQVTPSNESIAQIQDHLYGVLTDRQRTVLETAYYAGFFEWPRHSSGEDISETLGITPATFHEHLRSAQQKIAAAVVDEPDTTRTDVESARPSTDDSR
ncbi:bacterio-opsin activator domain-containing protein [Natronococcus sp. A-GB1]|uniref:bacterio-opsin activator domain-containing protein n=1 Tax=Natronococcus sp. A-GB1 TaxID=3037648 RepID=UPI00241FCF3C|nr:bacterio-opsin activator domain-containing protein [Natronococcus sp. A-GB1]MDG5761488.1 bacterio-opsin activator domain-containing protein [Natronococcus sp. A-GB1]